MSIWLTGFIGSCPLLFFTNYSGPNNNECYLVIDILALIYTISLNVIFIFIPTIGLSFLYAIVVINLNHKNKDISISKYSRTSKGSMSNAEYNSISTKKTVCIENVEIFAINREETTKNTVDEESKNVSPINSHDRRTQTNPKSSDSFLVRNSKDSHSTTNHVMILLLITVLFYFCQLPLRIFLIWSYINNYLLAEMPDMYFQEKFISEQYIDLVNFISNSVKVIYFLHCISNPIIYNIMSSRFRTAFFRSSPLKKS